MTKFVLHGGFKKGSVQEDDVFFQEILKDTSEDVKILLVYFAEQEEKIQLRIEQDKQQFNKNKGVKNLYFNIATEETFIEDCKWADIIYLHGGRTVKLMEVLKRFENLGQVFSDKTIAGDSAGANALGQLSYSVNSQEIREGLRILPFKIVPHYTDGAPDPFANTETNLETLFLREYETVVKYY